MIVTTQYAVHLYAQRFVTLEQFFMLLQERISYLNLGAKK